MMFMLKGRKQNQVSLNKDAAENGSISPKKSSEHLNG